MPQFKELEKDEHFFFGDVLYVKGERGHAHRCTNYIPLKEVVQCAVWWRRQVFPNVHVNSVFGIALEHRYNLKTGTNWRTAVI